MNNRRHFLLQGGLATAALLLTKPSAAVTKVQSWFPQLSISGNYLTIVHGAQLPGDVAASYTFKNSTQAKPTNVLLIDTQATSNTSESTLQKQDAATGIRYSVINKDGRLIGVVHAPAVLTKDAIKAIDAIAGKLKQQHQCQLVVCAWQVATSAFTSQRPEQEMAGDTQHIDVFAGTTTILAKCRHTIIANNGLGHEVVFQYHTSTGLHNGMKIGFDAMGKRNHIAFQ